MDGLGSVFAGLVQHAERRREIDYTLWVLASDEINAFAVPGGFIFVTFGLLKLMRQATIRANTLRRTLHF